MKVYFILTAGFWSENNLLHFFLSSPPPSFCVCTQVWACLCSPRDPACPGAVTPPIREEQQLSGHHAAGQGLPTLYPAHSVLPTLLQLAPHIFAQMPTPLQALLDPSFYSTDHCLILTWVCEPVFPVNMGTPRIPSLSAQPWAVVRAE